MRTLLLLLASLTLASPASAEDVYADVFARGMGHWADGSYAQAVTQMSRAYALRPNPHALRMIVRAYDFMGHCNAAQAHLQMLREEFSDTSRVELQKCANPASVKLECSSPQLMLVIDDVISTRCGAQVALPAGRHRVAAPAAGWSREVVLARGESRVLHMRPSPKKWSGAHTISPSLLQRARIFTVYVTPDGRRQVWVPAAPTPPLVAPVEPKAAKSPGKFPPVTWPTKFRRRSR